MHTHRVGQAPLRRGGLFTTRAAARRDVTAAQRRPKVPCASGLVFRRPAQIWEAGRWLHIGTFGLLGILLVTTVRPHPSRRRRPASRSCPFERAAASGTQSGHSPHPCSAFATFCRSARSKRAVRRQRHTPVQSLLPSCRRPNSSRCAGAMGHWLCALRPPAMYVLCVCVAMPFDVRSRSGGGMSLHTGRVAHAARSRLGGFGPRPHARAFCSRGPPTAPRV